MPTTTQRIRVQNKINEIAKAFDFYPVVYAADGSASIGTPAVRPASVLVNETDSSFEIDKKYGRGLREKPSNWNISVMLKFNQEVDLSFFEKYLINNLPFIPKDDINGLESVILRLSRMTVSHPPRQGSANGTDTLLTFEAITGRN